LVREVTPSSLSGHRDSSLLGIDLGRMGQGDLSVKFFRTFLEEMPAEYLIAALVHKLGDNVEITTKEVEEIDAGRIFTWQDPTTRHYHLKFEAFKDVVDGTVVDGEVVTNEIQGRRSITDGN
jgi:hypothetical protein